MIANSITVSRMLFSLLMLGLPMPSYLFAVCYLLCGVTDVLDGFVARKLHTKSEKGAMLDSTADLIFALIYAVKILPLLHIPLWIWIWTAGIAMVKISGIILTSKREHKLSIAHSFANKLTGILVFLLPLSAYIVDMKYSAAVVCAVATVATIEEIKKGHKQNEQI